ncbi:hypothetical protein BDP55DRAFT_70543 [Colletotrichum godetiae]|uniref:Uncharacterized protein n=1 Tax=Colletotrichum godetiae TaxID=1209918 RepID=A0AAJ0EUP0_9PEZI|nr:uncharacterized protein BDP55DRAFT_70543 [Colletotrichum godetiae]KAK1687849.1 hypothetical protein BDP55DRAFT_70543 [Colletotrichum godetiae]
MTAPQERNTIHRQGTLDYQPDVGRGPLRQRFGAAQGCLLAACSEARDSPQHRIPRNHWPRLRIPLAICASSRYVPPCPPQLVLARDWGSCIPLRRVFNLRTGFEKTTSLQGVAPNGSPTMTAFPRALTLFPPLWCDCDLLAACLPPFTRPVTSITRRSLAPPVVDQGIVAGGAPSYHTLLYQRCGHRCPPNKSCKVPTTYPPLRGSVPNVAAVRSTQCRGPKSMTRESTNQLRPSI